MSNLFFGFNPMPQKSRIVVSIGLDEMEKIVMKMKGMM